MRKSVSPVAAALYGPKVALVALVIMDSLSTIPVTIPVLGIARWKEGLPVGPAVMLGVAAAIPYFAGLLIGSKLGTRAGDEFYRRMTFVLIVLAAVLALPAVESVFRWLAAIAG